MKSANSRIDIVRGDITAVDADAIVNAANTTLLGGGGVDGAIHRAAGPELLAECRTLGGCQPGEAKLTRGYRLPARFVIHTVGPFWTGGKRGEPQILANCYRNSLQLAVKNRIRTIAFPAISCGAYGYPIREAARIAVDTTREFLATDAEIDKVTFVLWSEDIYEAYRRLL
jgi:O-acetyl-ADP-ribose deacetylase